MELREYHYKNKMSRYLYSSIVASFKCVDINHFIDYCKNLSEICVHLMKNMSHRDHRGHREEILCALCVLCGRIERIE